MCLSFLFEWAAQKSLQWKDGERKGTQQSIVYPTLEMSVNCWLSETCFHYTKREEMGLFRSISNQTVTSRVSSNKKDISCLNLMDQQSWCQTGFPLFTWWRCPFVNASDALNKWLSGCIITLSESEAPALRLGPACLLIEHIELRWLSEHKVRACLFVIMSLSCRRQFTFKVVFPPPQNVSFMGMVNKCHRVILSLLFSMNRWIHCCCINTAFFSGW